MVRLSAAARALIVSGFVTLGVGATGAAQDQQAQSWQLNNLRARWCVYFLVDSLTAEKKLPGNYRPRPARDFPGLSPAITRLIHDEPTYAAWIPAQFCSSHFDRARVDDQQVGDSAAVLEDSQVLSTWLIGASPAADSTSGRATYFIAALRSNNWRLLRQAELWALRGDRLEATVGKVPESTEDLFQVRIGRTVVTWEGHLAGDSAWAPPAVEESWYTDSSRNSRITGLASFRPDSAQSIAGTLRIVGKDDLAKSLRASPIRMVGPMMWGGGGKIDFSK